MEVRQEKAVGPTFLHGGTLQGQFEPKREGGNLLGPLGSWAKEEEGVGPQSFCLPALCHDMMRCHNSLQGANEL